MHTVEIIEEYGPLVTYYNQAEENFHTYINIKEKNTTTCKDINMQLILNVLRKFYIHYENGFEWLHQQENNDKYKHQGDNIDEFEKKYSNYINLYKKDQKLFRKAIKKLKK